MSDSPKNQSLKDMLTKSQRLVLGLFILLLVDVIWVLLSEVSKLLYQEHGPEKPYFMTYFKTSMFSLYLLGLCFWPPWKDTCNRPPAYMFIDPNTEDENFYTDASVSLSDPTFVPVKTPDRGSGTESDDSSVRSVRFSRLAEVRHMSEADAAEALLARLSYQATIRASSAARRAAGKLPISDIIRIALGFSLLYFIASYTHRVSEIQSETTTATILVGMATVFTLAFAALFPANSADRITFSKVVAVSISISGLVLVGLADLSLKSRTQPIVFLAFVSAFFYALYLVFLRRKIDNEDKMDIPLFFGFVGIFNTALLWPGLLLLHLTGLEEFEWPPQDRWPMLALEILIGTILSQPLWLRGCYFTSTLIATLSLSLIMPLTMVADVLLRGVEYPLIAYIGTLPLCIGFFATVLLAFYDNWDPVMEAVQCGHVFICRKTRQIRINESDSEQTEALIGINSSNNHEA